MKNSGRRWYYSRREHSRVCITVQKALYLAYFSLVFDKISPEDSLQGYKTEELSHFFFSFLKYSWKIQGDDGITLRVSIREYTFLYKKRYISLIFCLFLIKFYQKIAYRVTNHWGKYLNFFWFKIYSSNPSSGSSPEIKYLLKE